MDKETKKMMYQLGGIAVMALAFYGIAMAVKAVAPAYIAQSKEKRR